MLMNIFLLLKKCFKVVGGARFVPEHVNFVNFEKRCTNDLKKDTLKNRIRAVESNIFKGTKFFGDKGASIDVLLDMLNVGMVFKFIMIYRDGRDVAVSGVRHNRNLKPPWSNSHVENIAAWQERIDGWLKVLNDNTISDHCILRFEDYIDNPGKNEEKVARLLGVKNIDLESGFSSKKSHSGYYKHMWKNWRKEIPKESLELLEKLNYL